MVGIATKATAVGFLLVTVGRACADPKPAGVGRLCDCEILTSTSMQNSHPVK
jgi:hypothetical protein